MSAAELEPVLHWADFISWAFTSKKKSILMAATPCTNEELSSRENRTGTIYNLKYCRNRCLGIFEYKRERCKAKLNCVLFEKRVVRAKRDWYPYINYRCHVQKYIGNKLRYLQR